MIDVKDALVIKDNRISNCLNIKPSSPRRWVGQLGFTVQWWNWETR